MSHVIETQGAPRARGVRPRGRAWIIAGQAAVPLTALAAFFLGALRRPDAILRPRFFVEDALFYADAQRGVPVWEPYAGYLNLPQRTVALLQSPFEPSVAALIGTLIALAVTACVAGFVASRRLESVLPDPVLRAGVGLLVVLIPQGGEPLGAPSHLQWYLAIFLVARLFADEPQGTFAPMIDRLAIVIGALSGPMGIVLAPAYLLWARRAFWWLAPAAAAQVLLLVMSPRSGGWYPSSFLIDILATRVIDQSVLGSAVLRAIPDGRFVIAVGLIILLVWALRAVPRHLWLPGLYVLVVPLVAGLAANPDRGAIMLTPWAAQRYFVVAGFVIAAGIALAAWHRRGPVQMVLVVLLAAGIAVDFFLAPRPA